MANRQTYVIGALGVLVGMVVASSAQRAQTVSFAGHDPNSDIVQQMSNFRRASGIWRQRSEEEALGNIFTTGRYYRLTSPRRSSLIDNVARRRSLREAGETRYFSAPEAGTVRGVPAVQRRSVTGCGRLTRQRYTRCLEAFDSGEPYNPSVWPIEYDN